MKIIDSAGRELAFDYNGEQKITRIRCTGDAEQNADILLISYEHDKDGNLIAFIDPSGHRYSYEYDKRHFMTKKTDRRGYSFHYEYDEKGQCVKTYGEDGLYSVEMQYFPSVCMTIVRSPNGGTYTCKYNEQNLVIKVTDPYQKAKISGYDEDANLITEIDENGNVRAYKYDDRGNRIEETDILGNISQAQFNERNKDEVRIDPIGASWQKEYDKQGNLIKETNPAGTVQEHSYDKNGRKIETIEPDGTVQQFVYYPNGSLRAMLDEAGNEIESYEYDLLGNRTALITGELRTEFVYDKLSRLVKVKYPAGCVEQNVFDAEGNVNRYINKRGNEWKYRYDSWNKLVEEIDPEGNATQYSYNKADEIEKVIDPNGNVTEYRYDLGDRLTHVVRNGRIKEEYIRDGAGNLIEKRTSSGESLLKATIGPNNLAEQKVWGDDRASFEYDPLGRISKAQIGKTSLEQAYEPGGRLALDKQNNHQVEHQFDKMGRQVKTVVDDFETAFEYEDDGSLIIQDALGQPHELCYEGKWLTSRLLPCGVRESFEYDDYGRLIKQIQSQSEDSEEKYQEREYQYDHEDNLIRVKDYDGKWTQYKYDYSDRLIRVQRNNEAEERYQYDPAGNLIAMPGQSGMKIGSGNQLEFANGMQYSYDTRGNLFRRVDFSKTTFYRYDNNDQLIEVQLPDGRRAKYGYDALGRRVSKEIDGKKTEYLWDGDRLQMEMVGDTYRRLYVYARPEDITPFMFIDYEQNEQEEWHGKPYYIHINQLHTPIAVTDEHGEVIWSAEVEPYGLTKVSEEAKIEFNLRLPGQYLDKETGLYYNRFRYYDPEIGRYIQSDPLGLEGGINLYAYA
ncbi:MAG: RHS repeat-associated core domain-containing protein, partial [Candidatus Desantisbacteria bacterium]